MPKVKKETVESAVKLVSFGIKATIPTQQYGNLQPEIIVQAGSIEEARAYVMPIIEDLYQTYAEDPINGRVPKFFNKADVIVNERVVDMNQGVIAMPDPEAKEPAPASVAPTQTSESIVDPVDFEKTEAYLKGEKAILGAATPEALTQIKNKIQESTKIEANHKPYLFTLLLKRRKQIEA